MSTFAALWKPMLVSIAIIALVAPLPGCEKDKGSEGPPAANLFVRVGPKGGKAFYEMGIVFTGKKESRSFQHGGKTYRYVIVQRPAGKHSSYKTLWAFTLFSGAGPKTKRLIRDIINNPKETGSHGGCHKLTDYESTGGLWIEIGVGGKKLAAKSACQKMRQP